MFGGVLYVRRGVVQLRNLWLSEVEGRFCRARTTSPMTQLTTSLHLACTTSPVCRTLSTPPASEYALDAYYELFGTDKP